jgi:hypothetical protein
MNVAASVAGGTPAILFVLFQVTNAKFVFKHPPLHQISQEEVQQCHVQTDLAKFKINLSSAKLLVSSRLV